ncbi:hypothetical protein ZIOFF_017197 [Zingiber officinale]|uniref:Uncharacterized protein n=1 Tax=Zingiber officinale TaxID=94328 RepID=A0A8J5H4F8_ZINOF|nr:hypothetical protein ZIOFF_017197 [Zingiber officinale]
MYLISSVPALCNMYPSAIHILYLNSTGPLISASRVYPALATAHPQPHPLLTATITSRALRERYQIWLEGLVKILKKYDKRTRALIRKPFIEKVLQQPFFTTDLLYKLVKECVAMLDHLFPNNNLSISAECDGQNGVPKPAQSGGRVPELEEIKYMQSLYMKSTVAPLRSLKQIRSKSSTVKTD